MVLWASFQYVPFIVGSCVLGGLALAGWRRTGETGALLVVIAAAVRLLHEAVAVYAMTRMFTVGAAAYGRWAMESAGFQAAGALIAYVLFIVGVALLLRRLPARPAAH